MTVKTPLWLERSDLWLYDYVWVIIPSQNPSSSGDQASWVSAFLVTVSAKHCARQRLNCRQKYGYSRLAVKYDLSESSQHTFTNILSFFLSFFYDCIRPVLKHKFSKHSQHTLMNILFSSLLLSAVSQVVFFTHLNLSVALNFEVIFNHFCRWIWHCFEIQNINAWSRVATCLAFSYTWPWD